MIIAPPLSVPPRHAFATDFREFATGSDPAGWTRRWVSTAYTVTANAALPGARGPQSAPGSVQDTSLQLNAPGAAVGDCDVVTLIYPSATGTQAGLVVRGNTGSTNGYKFATAGNGTQVLLTKPNVGTLSTVSFSYSAATLYFIRMRAQGTSIQCRIWAASSPEPGTWNISATDSAYATGFVGVATYSNGGNCTFGWFAAQLGAGSAPLPSG